MMIQQIYWPTPLYQLKEDDKDRKSRSADVHRCDCIYSNSTETGPRLVLSIRVIPPTITGVPSIVWSYPQSATPGVGRPIAERCIRPLASASQGDLQLRPSVDLRRRCWAQWPTFSPQSGASTWLCRYRKSTEGTRREFAEWKAEVCGQRTAPFVHSDPRRNGVRVHNACWH